MTDRRSVGQVGFWGTDLVARVTKAPEVRREELLDVAFELCRTQGFETMSVEQVAQAAGVAKGTFYHYFTSKADLQLQLVQRFGDSLFAHMSARLATATGNAVDRTRALMQSATEYKQAERFNLAYAAFLYREENFALRHRVYASWREQARLVLLPVIRDGVADGSLSVADPEGAADIVLLLWFDAADHLWNRALAAADADAFAEVMVTGAAAILQAQERILGAPDGSFAVPIAPQALAVIKALHSRLQENQS